LIEHPYRYFFPLAAMGLVFGVGLWSASPAGPMARAYLWHAEAMIALFLLPVGAGFLLYTLPRFFATARATPLEAWTLFLLQFSMLGIAIFGAVAPIAQAYPVFAIYSLVKFASVAWLALFAARRYPGRDKFKPIFQSFFTGGLALALSGSLAQTVAHLAAHAIAATGDARLAQSFAENFAPWRLFLIEYHRAAFQYGFFWMLFTGMGIRLFPMLTLSTRPADAPEWQKRFAYNRKPWILVSTLLAATFVLQALLARETDGAASSLQRIMLTANFGLRAALSVFVAWQGWLLFQRSARRGIVPFFLKLALLTTLVGHGLVAVFPGEAKHWSHLVFGAGFGMGTMLVMTRIVLAHEQADLHREIVSRAFLFAFGAIYLSVWTRATAHLLAGYLPHLSYAALLWLSGVAVWAATLLYYVTAGKTGAQYASTRRQSQPQSQPK
jgi:hypothetical protein